MNDLRTGLRVLVKLLGAACLLASLTVCSISRQELGNSLIPETVKAGRQTDGGNDGRRVTLE